ncbi:lipid-A-disaccharide synthase [Gammaproteobacteria bacterium]|nr:lipid-A-disaccharide synthase [Gammaproteobacteria bacterium]
MFCKESMVTMQAMLLAGEASGDILGSDILVQANKQFPKVRWVGTGGRHCRDAGLDIIYDITDLSVMGFAILGHLTRLWGIYNHLKRVIRTQRPQVLITVDYPGLNLRLSRYAKSLGIKTIHVVSPQFWAWRPKRLYQMPHLTDKMAVLWPFEVPYYQSIGMPVVCIGHRAAQLKTLSPPANPKPVIGLLPGSRPQEIERHFSLMVEAAQQLGQRYVGCRFVLLTPQHLVDHPCYQGWPKHLSLTTQHQISPALAQVDVALVCSGTATFEVAMLGVPMVIIYRTKAWSYWLAKQLVQLKQIGLPNILHTQANVPELIQSQANPKAIAQALEQLLNDQARQAKMRQVFKEIKQATQPKRPHPILDWLTACLKS